jgi:regulator of protease activity HflC (stomatin/prohibitin superfamily)
MKSKIKKFYTWTILILLVVFAIFIYWKYFFTYSEGNRAGLLQKFSKRGQIFKTWEGEMILSSVRSSQNVALASEKFLFSVTDIQAAEKLSHLEGSFVTVHYTEKNGKLFWKGDTEYFVDSVTVMHNE